MDTYLNCVHNSGFIFTLWCNEYWLYFTLFLVSFYCFLSWLNIVSFVIECRDSCDCRLFVDWVYFQLNILDCLIIRYSSVLCTVDNYKVINFLLRKKENLCALMSFRLTFVLLFGFGWSSIFKGRKPHKSGTMPFPHSSLWHCLDLE